MAQSLTGLDCVLAYASSAINDSDNTPEDASWTEIDVVGDVTPSMGHVSANFDTRGNNGFRTNVITLKEVSVSVTAEWKPDDTGWQEFRDAYQNGTEVPIAVLDGSPTTSGSQGPAGNWVVTQFDRPESPTEVVTTEITLEPSSYMSYWIKS